MNKSEIAAAAPALAPAEVDERPFCELGASDAQAAKPPTPCADPCVQNACGKDYPNKRLYEDLLQELHQNLHNQLFNPTVSFERHRLDQFLFGIVDEEISRIHGYCTCASCGELHETSPEACRAW